jgi:hypothetical protein
MLQTAADNKPIESAFAQRGTKWSVRRFLSKRTALGLAFKVVEADAEKLGDALDATTSCHTDSRL